MFCTGVEVGIKLPEFASEAKFPPFTTGTKHKDRFMQGVTTPAR